MKIALSEVIPFAVPFKKPLVTSQQTYAERKGFVLKLCDEDGFVAFGEASPLPGFSAESLEIARQALDGLSSALQLQEFSEARDQSYTELAAIGEELALPPAVSFAFETAVFGLLSQRASLPLAKWLTPEALPKLSINALVSLDAQSLSEDLQTQTFKCKLSGAVADLPDKIERFLNLMPEGSLLRLDANQGYTEKEALYLLEKVTDDRIEYIEELLVAPDAAALQRIHALARVPLALDESLGSHFDIDQVIAAGIADVLVLKPSHIGGFSRVLSIAERARSAGRKIIITSMLEAGVGVLACMHCAAAIGVQDGAAGLDTLRLLEDPLIDSVPGVQNGVLTVPVAAGLGAQFRAADPA